MSVWLGQHAAVAQRRLLRLLQLLTPDTCVCVHRTANYKITGVGVEDLEVSFPWTAYLDHHEGACLARPFCAGWIGARGCL